MNKIVQRIVTLLLVLLLTCGMFPAVFATDAAPEDTTAERASIVDETIDAAETESESTEPVATTESTAPTENAAEQTAEFYEETVTASPIYFDTGSEDAVPMLMAADDGILLAAAASDMTGTHYQRAVIWLTSSESWDFTYKGKSYSKSSIVTHGVSSNGKRYLAYCIDPGINTTQSSSAYTGSETAWTELDINTQSAIALTILYGAPNKLYSTDKLTQLTYELATQIVIHELTLGYRSNVPPYSCSNTDVIDTMTYGGSAYFRSVSSMSADYGSIHNKRIDKTLLREAYNTISTSLASHYVLPSFASRYNAAAKTYEMTKQSNGTYAVTLTDTNNILSACSFKNGNGLTYTVNGNKLTITASTAFDGTKSCALSGSIGVSKQVPNLESETFLLWKAGNYQRLVTLQDPLNDPLPLYFNVKIPIQNGTAKIVKTATNGGTVAGWHFEVKDANGKVVGNYTTDATGVIAVELVAGTYTITETDGAAKYWVNDPTPTRTITVKAGETTTVTFKNQWRGQSQIMKTATNGGTLKGWEFTITEASGTKVGTYTTDDTGKIVVDLEPGTYTVQETDKNDPYWYCDTQPQTITVKAGETAKVTFKNQWIGKTKIIKTLANPEAGNVEGWTFTIIDSSGKEIGTYKTDSNGVITTDLEPGTYTVTEVLEEGSLWQCTTANPQTITVNAGSTAEVTFTNALRPGKLQVKKVDEHGEPLAGAEFLLEWSDDGKTWKPITYTDSAVPQIGASTTAGIKNGKLITDITGLIEFTGLYPRHSYRLTETKAPDGYQLLAGPVFEGTLPADQDVSLGFTVTNIPVFKLPETGSRSMVMTISGLVLCCIACVGVIYFLRRKEK